MIDGATDHRGLGGDLETPGSWDVLLHGVGNDVAVGAVIEHLAMKRAGSEPDRQDAAFQPQRYTVLNDGAQKGFPLEDLIRRATPSLAEIADG